VTPAQVLESVHPVHSGIFYSRLCGVRFPAPPYDDPDGGRETGTSAPTSSPVVLACRQGFQAGSIIEVVYPSGSVAPVVTFRSSSEAGPLATSHAPSDDQVNEVSP